MTTEYLEDEYYKMLFEIRKSNNLAMFDLDHTLIKPLSGGTFPKYPDDWTLIQKVVYFANKYNNLGYNMVIVSNQKKFNKEEFEKKFNDIFERIGFKFNVYVCIGDNYRKPLTNIYKMILSDFNLNNILIKEFDRFYVGDAGGDINDFSDTDYKFAINIGVNFIYSKNIEHNCIIDLKIPEKIFDKLNIEKYVIRDDSYKISKIDKQEIILLVGSPGSGKSTW